MWPDRGPYRIVGDPTSGYHIKMPLSVVEAVQQTVPDDPAKWVIYRRHDFSKQGKPIWEVSGTSKLDLCLLGKRSSWTNLSALGSAPFLNEVLETLPAAGLQDQAKLEKYLIQVAQLQGRATCVALTKQFRREHLTHARLIDGFDPEDKAKILRSPVAERFTREEIDSWLQGTEKSRRALLSLCHDLVLTRGEDRSQATVRGNVMDLDGAVEQWTLHLEVEPAVKLQTIEVKTLCPEGTFFYPLVQ